MLKNWSVTIEWDLNKVPIECHEIKKLHELYILYKFKNSGKIFENWLFNACY